MSMTAKEAVERIEDMQRSLLFDDDAKDDDAIELALAALRDSAPRVITEEDITKGMCDYPLQTHVEVCMYRRYSDEYIAENPWKKTDVIPLCYPDIVRTTADGEYHCDGGNMKISDYGITYRFWNHRPSREMMLSTPWNER